MSVKNVYFEAQFFIPIFRKSHEETIKGKSTLMSNQIQKSWSLAGNQDMDTVRCQNTLVGHGNQRFLKCRFYVARKMRAAKMTRNCQL